MVEKSYFGRNLRGNSIFLCLKVFFCDKKGSLNRLQKVQFW